MQNPGGLPDTTGALKGAATSWPAVRRQNLTFGGQNPTNSFSSCPAEGAAGRICRAVRTSVQSVRRPYNRERGFDKTQEQLSLRRASDRRRWKLSFPESCHSKNPSNCSVSRQKQKCRETKRLFLPKRETKRQNENNNKTSRLRPLQAEKLPLRYQCNVPVNKVSP